MGGGEPRPPRPNPDYWEAGRPQLDEVIVRIVPGTAGQRALLQRQEADLQLHVPTADVGFVRGLADYRVVPAPTYAWWHFWLNNAASTRLEGYAPSVAGSLWNAGEWSRE